MYQKFILTNQILKKRKYLEMLIMIARKSILISEFRISKIKYYKNYEK